EKMKLEIDQQRLNSEIEALAVFSDAEPPAVTRIVFTPTDLKARAWVITLCEEAKLAVRQDAIGNIFARWTGADAAAPAVGTGSHIDAIPNAGKYDGVVGVLGGLEAIRALQRSGFRPKHSIELLVFATEEPTRFGIGCLGSRLLSGTLSAKDAAKLKDRDGESVDEVRRKAGFNGNLQDVKLPKSYYKAFVELHIEQGPLLERAKTSLGSVKSIAAPADSCREHGFPFLEMVSRAYHDSLFISPIAPTGMLFIPCRNGYSHRPDEYAAPEDIARGALVLAEALAKLSA